MTEQTPTARPAVSNTSKKPGSALATPSQSIAMARRRFSPDFFTGTQTLLREALDLTENDHLPDVFRVPVAVPLKIGIKTDLQNRYGLRDPNHPRLKLLTRALKRYSRSPQYHHAVLNTKTRFDMNLKPAQPITDEDRRHARQKLEWLRRTREKARIRKAEEAARANSEAPSP